MGQRHQGFSKFFLAKQRHSSGGEGLPKWLVGDGNKHPRKIGIHITVQIYIYIYAYIYTYIYMYQYIIYIYILYNIYIYIILYIYNILHIISSHFSCFFPAVFREKIPVTLKLLILRTVQLVWFVAPASSTEKRLIYRLWTATTRPSPCLQIKSNLETPSFLNAEWCRTPQK